jgi:hypothetical protein
VWRSLRADEQRDWVRQCPGCWAECEVVPNAIYTLDLIKPRRIAPGRQSRTELVPQLIQSESLSPSHESCAPGLGSIPTLVELNRQ